MPDPASVSRLIAFALEEDIGTGDITTQFLIPQDEKASLRVTARQPLVACGLEVAADCFLAVSEEISMVLTCVDGEALPEGGVLMQVSGPLRSLLTAERTALNFLQRMSGVATHTRRFAEAIEGTGAQLLDTRKTIPGWRALDKYAAFIGGAINHRMGLYDAVLIKDNHLAYAGSITEAIQKARAKAPTGTKIQVECDTLKQVEEALAAAPDAILLDNMPPDMLREAVALRGQADIMHIELEASGGITLENIRAVAETGVDSISIGALTHSAPAVDIGLDWE